MIAFLVFAFLIPAGVLATEGHRQCSGVPAALSIDVEGCSKAPCDLVRGKDAIVNMTFLVPRDTKTLTPLVHATSLGITIPYPLPKEQANGCEHLLNGNCPCDKGENIKYQMSMPVLSIYPKVDVDLRFDMADDAGNSLFCFLLKTQVVDS